MSARLDREIARGLRWYPADWRERNGEALRGALLDQAEATGADRLGFRDRVSLATAGLSVRDARRRRGATYVGAALLLTLALVYAIGISWSPGLEAPGVFLGFSNPSVVALAVGVASGLTAVFSLPRATGVLGVTAILIQLAFTVAGGLLGWQGPSWSLFLVLAGLVTLAAAPFQRRWSFLAVIAAVTALAVAVQLVTLVLIPLLADIIG